jgi:hypothetical protein
MHEALTTTRNGGTSSHDSSSNGSSNWLTTRAALSEMIIKANCSL